MEQVIKKQVKLMALLKCLLFSYILTGVSLLLLAMLLYKLKLSEGVVSIGIILIYVLASFFAGFAAGKKLETRKFLWGLLMGAVYFLILVIVSFGVHRSIGDIASNFFTTFLICGGSGMLGGMLS